jgi:hypothetical protein
MLRFPKSTPPPPLHFPNFLRHADRRFRAVIPAGAPTPCHPDRSAHPLSSRPERSGVEGPLSFSSPIAHLRDVTHAATKDSSTPLRMTTLRHPDSLRHPDPLRHPDRSGGTSSPQRVPPGDPAPPRESIVPQTAKTKSSSFAWMPASSRPSVSSPDGALTRVSLPSGIFLPLPRHAAQSPVQPSASTGIAESHLPRAAGPGGRGRQLQRPPRYWRQIPCPSFIHRTTSLEYRRHSPG